MHTFLCVVLFVFCYNELSFALNIERLENKDDTKIPEFRYDYVFIDGIDGWLKLHQVPATWDEARIRCKREGGELATPLDLYMVEAMMNVLKNQAYPSVFTGIHSQFSYGDYYSIKGVPLGRIPVTWTTRGPSSDVDKRCAVFLRNGTITNDYCTKASYPYMCYKRNNNETLGSCGTIDKEYNHVHDLDTCYKIHGRRTTWRDAFMTCSAEGAHLLVINNEQEFKSVFALLQSYPVEVKENVFVGIINHDKSGQWITIHGDELEESGFSKWLPGEPNNPNAEFCGSVIRAEGYNDAPCDAKLPFVCEKATDSLKTKEDIFDISKFYRSSF